MACHPGKFVTIYQFSPIFAEAWQNAMTTSTVMASFKATGVYPLNRNAVDIPGEVDDKPIVTPTEKLAKCLFTQVLTLRKKTKSPSSEADFTEKGFNYKPITYMCNSIQTQGLHHHVPHKLVVF